MTKFSLAIFRLCAVAYIPPFICLAAKSPRIGTRAAKVTQSNGVGDLQPRQGHTQL